MPGPSDIATGNLQLHMLLQATLSPASVAANTTAEQTFTVNGILLSDFVLIQKPTAQAGLGIVGSRATANGSIGITFANTTASPIVPTAGEVYLINLVRQENTGPLPTAVV